MDIIIKRLTKEFLHENLKEFILLIQDEPFEYWNEDNFNYVLPGKFQTSHIALFNNRLCGFIISSIKTESVHIHKFMTDRDFRNRGIGNALQKDFEKRIIGLNITKITLNVLSSNERGIKFYKKQGFAIEGERQDSVTGQKLYLMSKNLQEE